jgi:hypothetical protein
MVPATYLRLDRLPLTPNGKLNRQALPAPESAAVPAHEYQEPQGEVEQALAEIWAEVLKLKRIGRQGHFFHLGGHSLLAVRVIARLRQRLGVEVAIRDVFLHPVLADLAASMDEAPRCTLPPILPAARSGPLPLSFAQQRLWFLAQMEGVSEAYHISGGVYLNGELDRVALRRALDRIIARHEALRSRLVLVDGAAVQQIAGPE